MTEPTSLSSRLGTMRVLAVGPGSKVEKRCCRKSRSHCRYSPLAKTWVWAEVPEVLMRRFAAILEPRSGGKIVRQQRLVKLLPFTLQLMPYP